MHAGRMSPGPRLGQHCCQIKARVSHFEMLACILMSTSGGAYPGDEASFVLAPTEQSLHTSARLSHASTMVAVSTSYSACSPATDILCGLIQTLHAAQVIAFASHPAALVMAAAEGGAPGLKPLSSFNSRANQQDLLAALNARIAKETAELADLRAKVAKERERYVGGNPVSRIQFMTAAVLGHCVVRIRRGCC